MAIDMLLASKGRCLYYTKHKLRLSDSKWTNLNWPEWDLETKILHEVQKDDTSIGFEEAWKWFTSEFPDVSLWVRKLLGIIALLFLVCVYVIIQVV